MTLETFLEQGLGFFGVCEGIFSSGYLLIRFFVIHRSSIWLSLFLLSTSASLFSGILNQNDGDFGIPILESFWLSAPFIFMYVQENSRWKWKYSYLLFIPFLIDLIFGGLEFFEPQIWSVSAIIYNGIVLVFVLNLLRKHRKELGQYYSSFEGRTFNWLRYLVIVNLGFIILWVADDGLSASIGENLFSGILSELSHYFTILLLVLAGGFGIHQSYQFDRKQQQYPIEEEEIEEETIEEKSTKDDFESLEKLIVSQQIFRNPDLSLKGLADAFGKRDKEVSEIINSNFEGNFYHFINGFRVEYFKSLVQDGKHAQMSLLGLAEESGFRSKSTFYSSFKKEVGTTPKEYVDQFK